MISKARAGTKNRTVSSQGRSGKRWRGFVATTGARASMVKRIGSVAGAIGLAFLGGCSTQGDRESRGEDRAYRRAVVPILQRAGELHNFGDFVDGESTPTDMGAAEAAESLYILRAAVVALPPAEDKRVRYLSLRLMRLAEAGLDLAARIDLVPEQAWFHPKSW